MRLFVVLTLLAVFHVEFVQAQTTSRAPASNLTIKEVSHKVSCPLPSLAKCVMKRPIISGYTVVTEDVVVEISGENWIVDFKKMKIRKSRKEYLRVLAASGELHVIEVSFPEEPAIEGNSTTNESNMSPLPLKQSGSATKTTVPANDPAVSGTTKPRDMKVDNTPSNPSTALGLVHTNAQSYCDAVRNNEVIQKFVALRKASYLFGLKAGGPTNEYLQAGLDFDTEDQLLKNWVKARVDESKLFANPESVKQIVRMVVECAHALKDTDFLYFFAGSDPEGLKKTLDTLTDGLKKKPRPIDAKGNVIQNDPSPTIDWGKNIPRHFGGELSTDFLQFKRSWPFWTVLFFPNGGNALKNISPEPLGKLKAKAEKAAAVAADAERKNREQTALAEKRAKEWKNRLGKIKSGDLKAAQSCREISEALAADEANGLLPGISASNEIRALRARLLDYDQDTLIKPGKGKLEWRGNYGEFRSTSKTVWFDRDSISPGNSEVLLVGKYIDNLTVSQKSGGRTKAPLFDGICVELYVSPEARLMFDKMERDRVEATTNKRN